MLERILSFLFTLGLIGWNIFDILNVGRKAVYGLIRQKRFPAIRIYNAGYRIPKDAFHAWLYQLKQ